MERLMEALKSVAGIVLVVGCMALYGGIQYAGCWATGEGIGSALRSDADPLSDGALSAKEQPHSACTLPLTTLIQTASQLNELMPMTVDSETEAMNVSASPCTFIYNYRLVNIDRDDVSASELQELQEYMQDHITNMACTTPDTRRDFLNVGVTISYVYHDQRSRRMMALEVEPADCPPN